ncbi:MAG: TetR/AcrR family transcriptional regulator [Acidobacteriota bacterium]|nr:TetR/AcrR family transcriptional regulator [Acidobacteriota bacterium]
MKGGAPPRRHKRGRLISAARELFHRRGYACTSLAMVAEHADVPLDNVYYYFRTKGALAAAVVGAHLTDLEAVIEECRVEHSPISRLESFVDRMTDESGSISAFGCPLGSLVGEMERGDGEVGARRLFELQLDWIAAQLGGLQDEEAQLELTIRVVSGIQGAAALAQGLGDPAVLDSARGALRRLLRDALRSRTDRSNSGD